MENFINNIAQLALRYAITQLGQQENPIGSNRGPMVNEYLKSVGLNPGYAWCQAFVHWCYGQAAAELKIVNPVVRTGGVVDCWNRTAVNFKVLAEQAKDGLASIDPGDQVIFRHSNGAGHTGIIEKLSWLDGAHHERGMVMHTIEGNTNNDGSREGYEVERKVRKFSDSALLGFIKY
jgi:hypothetical protein